MTAAIGFTASKSRGRASAVAGSVQRDGKKAADGTRLTERQREILRLLARGFYYKETGAALGISRFTVRSHLHAIYQRLAVKSRLVAVLKFQEHDRQQQN